MYAVQALSRAVIAQNLHAPVQLYVAILDFIGAKADEVSFVAPSADAVCNVQQLFSVLRRPLSPGKRAC